MADVDPARLLRAAEETAIRFLDDAARRVVTAAVGEDGGRWELTKQNASRSVYRSLGDGPLLYLKHFHNPSPLHRLQRRLNISDAAREMRFSRHLSAHGVAVPRVLATCCRNGAEWLISEGISPAEQGDAWHAAALAAGDHAAIRAATVALAELVAHMHAAGVSHRDLHAGNVLIRPGRPLSPVLMDLHRMALRRRLSRRVRAANLAQLLNDRLPWTTRSQRLRFLVRYLRAGDGPGSVRGWARMIQHLTDRRRRRTNARIDARPFKTNRYFARCRIAGCRAHVILDSKRILPGSRASEAVFTAEDWRKALADPEALLTGPGASLVKDMGSALVVRRRLSVGPVELDVFIKRNRRRHARRWLADLFRRSRAVRAFGLGHALLGRFIYTALPLAAMEKRRGRFLLDSILVTEAVDSAVDLNRFLRQRLTAAEGPGCSGAGRHHKRTARHVLWQLGRLLQRLHADGFVHRDLKAGNVLVRWDGSDAAPPEVVLIDLDGLRRVRRVTQRREFQELMRLNVSLLECPVVTNAGRLRMLLGYLRRPGSGEVNFKPIWRALQRWSQRKIRRQIAFRQRRQKAQRRGRT